MKKIAWCITPPSKGSGGFRTICNKINALQARGYENHVFITPNAVSLDNAETVSSHMKDWFNCRPDGVYLQESVPADFDAVIATAWDTASFAANQDSPCKLYFVQDYEPWFHPLNYDRLRAERSYDLGLKPITMGRWLSWKLSSEKGIDALYCDFGADLSTYHPLSIESDHAVCAIYQPEKDRRLAKLLEEAILVLLDSDPTVKVHLFGSDSRFLPFEDRVFNHGLISLKECNELYNSVACGISISGSNPSRIPYEMMAAGLPVVDLYLVNNLFDFKNRTIELVDASPAGVASGVLRLLRDASQREERSKSARLWMLDRDISVEDAMFCEAIEQNLTGEGTGCSFDFSQKSLYESGAAEILPEVLENCKRRRRGVDHDCLLAKTEVPVVSFRAVVECPVVFRERPMRLRVATWTQHDQSDIQWFLGSRCESGILLEGDLFLANETAVARFFHFYWFETEDTPVLLHGAVQASKGAGPDQAASKQTGVFARKITAGTFEIDLKFYDHSLGRSTCVMQGIGAEENSLMPQSPKGKASLAFKLIKRIKR